MARRTRLALAAENTEGIVDGTFDFIIIGAGSAGGVLANRLSADPATHVLLIEAGGSGRGFTHDIPAGSLLMLGNPKYDWIYPMEPDPSSNGRAVQWAGGKALGGSSAINGMVYVRGTRHDYDDWAAGGCPGWGFNDVLPYFRKMETFAGPPSQFRGSHGPLSVSPPREMHPASHVFLAAAAELGLPLREDYADGDQYGAFACQGTLDRGLRCSVRRAYIDAAEKRPNVAILTETTADSILFDGRRAVGVQVTRKGRKEVYRTRGEVLICCGSLQSPTLLMRSGIGPAEDLRAAGVPLIHDLPGVGRNLQEHVGVVVARGLNIPTYNTQVGPLHMAAHLARFLLFRRGALTSLAVQALAYFKSAPDLAEPDFMCNFFPLAVDFNAKPPKLSDRPGVAIGVNLCKPKGRGRIRLRDASPESKPVIDHRLLGDEDDVRRLVLGMKTAEKLFDSASFAPYLAGRMGPPEAIDTDAGWIDYLKANCAVGYHGVGTCRMGRGPDAVVDPSLRVYGVDGLRVIDASIMPRITSGNTNAPTIMIGERASDLILKDRNASPGIP